MIEAMEEQKPIQDIVASPPEDMMPPEIDPVMPEQTDFSQPPQTTEQTQTSPEQPQNTMAKPTTEIKNQVTLKPKQSNSKLMAVSLIILGVIILIALSFFAYLKSPHL